jgi:hypothetical protein
MLRVRRTYRRRCPRLRSESLLQLLPEVDMSSVVVLERDALVPCEVDRGHRVGRHRAPFLTAICCRP